MPSSHFSRAAIAACAFAVPLGASAQIVPVPPAPEGNATSFTIFLRAAPIGAEQVSVTRIADGWTITSTGRMAPPIDIVARRIQVRYTADWRPIEFTFDGTVRGQAQHIHTTIEDTTAHSEITVGEKNGQKNDPIDAASLLLSTTSFFGPYEALAVRVRGATPGTEIPAYTEGSMVPFTIKVGDSAVEQIQTTARLVSTRRTHLVMQVPQLALDADIWTDDAGRMVRFSVLSQSLDVVREDVAAVSSRTVTISRPNDERINIPSNGFTLAATVSRPAGSTATKMPAVVLVGGSGPTDRDGIAFGIPILGELAGALADAGFMVVRYDKRGVGQSGGRAESATLTDYAEDARAAVKWLADRKDVDPKRIALVGHSEGGLVSLIAAGKDKKIAAVVLVATPGMPGSDVVLAQQRRLLDRMKLSRRRAAGEDRCADRDRSGRHDRQGSRQAAAGRAPQRRQSRVPEHSHQRSREADEGRASADPDRAGAARRTGGRSRTRIVLAALAKQRKNAPPVDVAKLPGVNHLLVPARTGEVRRVRLAP